MANEQCMQGDIMPFAADMKKMINNKDLSDIKFLIGPNRKTVHSHRMLLSARCEVFRAMFADQAQKGGPGIDQEVPFVLSDITPEIFLAILEFLYTNCVSLSSKTAIDVLGGALEYGLDELRKLCVDYLIENLSINNACDVMQAAVTYGQDELRESTMDYIEQNTQNVFKTKSFHEMSEDALSVTLQSDKLLMDELDILGAVKEWATVNSVVLGRPISDVAQNVVKHLRLPLLSADEITEVEQECRKDRMIPLKEMYSGDRLLKIKREGNMDTQSEPDKSNYITDIDVSDLQAVSMEVLNMNCYGEVEVFSFAWKCHALKKGEQGNPLTKPRKGTKTREFHKVLQSL